MYLKIKKYISECQKTSQIRNTVLCPDPNSTAPDDSSPPALRGAAAGVARVSAQGLAQLPMQPESEILDEG